MKFCQKCGKEIMQEAKFCSGCGAVVEKIAEEKLEEVATNEASAKEKVQECISSEENAEEQVAVQAVETEPKTETFATPIIEPLNFSVVSNIKKTANFKITKKLGIILAAVIVVVIIAVIVIANSIKLSKYEDTIEKAYENMCYGAEQAERYASLESKVWRNCINKQSSTETDEYTTDEYGYYYSDFNDALQEFFDAEYLTYSVVSSNVSSVNSYMAELKDCPDKFEDEYRALKELYVAYSGLTDLVVGDSSYSLNSFSEAFETAKLNYKTAKSSASLIIE